MSFGRPPSVSTGFQVTPPDRGSFPLDHFGECKEKMKLYLKCLQSNESTSSPCRILSKDYLDCRMKNGLMGKDEWENLGLGNLDKNTQATAMSDSSRSSSQSTM